MPGAIVATVREPGYFGQLVSLGGIKSRAGVGRRIDDYSYSTAGTFLILPTNPHRLWASFFNNGPGYMTVSFGGNDYFAKVTAGGFVLINEATPWTGAVHVGSSDATDGLFIYECSLDVTT